MKHYVIVLDDDADPVDVYADRVEIDNGIVAFSRNDGSPVFVCASGTWKFIRDRSE